MSNSIDPQNGFRFNFNKIEVVPLEQADPGINHEWIARSTFADRARALELLRWQAFGQDRTQSSIRRVFEVLKRPEG